MVARAQQGGRVIRIGFFGASPGSEAMSAQYASFLAALRQQGFSVGQNLVIDYRRNDDPRMLFSRISRSTVQRATGSSATTSATPATASRRSCFQTFSAP